MGDLSVIWLCGNCDTRFVAKPDIGPVCPKCAWWMCGGCNRYTDATHYRYTDDGIAYHE